MPLSEATAVAGAPWKFVPDTADSPSVTDGSTSYAAPADAPPARISPNEPITNSF